MTSLSAGPRCQAAEVFGLLNKAHMLTILSHLVRDLTGPARFTEIQTALNLSPNTLASRLKDLEAAGLVDRQAFKEIPPRVEYVATAKAHDLGRVFAVIDDWAGRHDLTAAEWA